jgi:hypothetical protein
MKTPTRGGGGEIKKEKETKRGKKLNQKCLKMGAKGKIGKFGPNSPRPSPSPLFKPSSLSLSFSFWGAMHNGKTSIDFHPIVEGEAETFRP